MLDFSQIRGTHYRINGDAERTARELGWGRRLGLNAVRFWMPGPGAWRAVAETRLEAPEARIAPFKDFVRQAHAAGYKSMPILFNGNGLDPAVLEESSWGICEAYAAAAVGALRGEPGLLAWDVMNEPTYNRWVREAPTDSERAARRAKTVAFLGRVCALVRRLDPATPVTIGCANAAEARECAPLVDAISFHNYGSTREDVEREFAAAEAAGREFGKPVMNTETGCLAYGNGYDMALEACARHGFGFFFFNLVIGGYTETFHGVFYDDGTIRDPVAVAAIMGCFRKRELSTHVPARPFKPGAESRLVEIVAALRGAAAAVRAEAPAPEARDRFFRELERSANYLEACELVPMNTPPTAKIAAWRSQVATPPAEALAMADEFAGLLEATLDK